MYLSRLTLNPKSREARRDLADVCELHRTILAAFPALPERTDFRRLHGVLFRVDIHGPSGVPTLLVQSQTEPDWSFLDSRQGYLLSDGRLNPHSKCLDDLYACIRMDQILAFRLRANVTKKIDTKTGSDGKRRNGKRVPLRTTAEQLAWLARKGQQGGFEPLARTDSCGVPEVDVRSESDLKGRRPSEDAPGRLMTFGCAVFEGRLRVTDAETFRKMLADGLGSGKAYGFGLMSIAPG